METLLKMLLLAACGLASPAPPGPPQAGGTVAAAEEPVSPRPQWNNLAGGKAVQFNTPPNYPAVTDPDDGKQIGDGRLSPATPMWYDQSAIGWVLVDPAVFTVDLGSNQPIRGVGLHIACGQAGESGRTASRST